MDQKNNADDTNKDLNRANRHQPGQNDSSGNPNNIPTWRPPWGFSVAYFILVVVLAVLFYIFLYPTMSESKIVIEYSQFIRLVESGNVGKVQVGGEAVQIALKKDADLATVERILYPNGRNPNSSQQSELTPDNAYIAIRIEDPTLVERLNSNNVDFYKLRSNSLSPGTILSWIAPVLLINLFLAFSNRKVGGRMGQQGGSMGGMAGIGRSKAREYVFEQSTGVGFPDVAGQDEAKESLSELVDYLKNPLKYQEIGAKQPKGALLVGPPGTGKTLLAKALAGEAGVPFYSISGSEFVEMFVGVGASRVRDMFEQAKKNAPSIIFIDEIDAIGKSRDNHLGSNDEREQTLNQLLSEMDGFSSTMGIVVIAATNRPEILDKALLRPGRFDRRVIVEKPDLIGREAILEVHANNVKIGSDVNLYEIALATPGATGADLANMINEGALLAVKNGRKTVNQSDLMEAVEVVIAGKEKKDRIMNAKERSMVAYHEVGHALVSALQKHSQQVQKITIVPRTMGSLGYTMNMPEEERYLLTKDELLAQITTLMGGRAAEIEKFGTVTTGAANDLERATALARSMVAQYGMGEKVGPMSLESIQNRYLDGGSIRNCSEETEVMIDNEARQILISCQRQASSLINSNRGVLDIIAGYLLEKENITGKEFMDLLEGYEKPA